MAQKKTLSMWPHTKKICDLQNCRMVYNLKWTLQKGKVKLAKWVKANAFPYTVQISKFKGSFPPWIFIWHDGVGHSPCPAPTWTCLWQSEHDIIFKPQTNFSTMDLHKANPSRKSLNFFPLGQEPLPFWGVGFL